MSTTTGFQQALSGLRATGASPSAVDLVRSLDRHGREESDLLDRYERFVETAPSPVARYLVRLISEEERRHHRMLEELANTIAWGHLGEEDHPSLPTSEGRGPVSRELRQETRALLQLERADRRHLRHLARRIRGYGDVPLWCLLIDLMRLDTEKHISILTFLDRNGTRGGGGLMARTRGYWRHRRSSK
jgi:hypothetical protein